MWNFNASSLKSWMGNCMFFFLCFPQVLMQVGEHARGVNLLASVSLLPMYHWCVWEEDAAESLMDPRRIVWTAVLIMIDARAV